jgi:hypothetical protein
VTFVDEVRAVGAIPLLVTSLSRRRFSNTTGMVTQNLADVSAAAQVAAAQSGAKLIDLNGASTRYLNAIGAERASRFNLKEGDYTHLNSGGSVVFGNLVAVLMREVVPELRRWIRPDGEVVEKLREGEFYWPGGV